MSSRPPKPASGNATARRLIAEAIPPRWPLYAFSLLCMVGVAVFTSLLAWSTKLIVNDVFVAGDSAAAARVALLVIGISLGKGISTYLNSVISVQFNRSVAADYKKRSFAKLLGQDIPYFAGHHAAHHMAQITLFGQSCGLAVTNITNKLLTDVLTLVALIGVMIWQDPLMSLFSAILFPLIFVLISRLTRRVRSLSRMEADLQGALSAVGTEALQGIKTVKSYGLEEKSRGRFFAAVDRLEERILRIAKSSALAVPLMEMLGGLTIGLFVLYAAWQTLENGKTPGEFTAFITAFMLAYAPAERISKLLVDAQKSLAHVERMYELLDRPQHSRETGIATLEGASSGIEFRNVSFGYEGGAPALHEVSFDIAPGERVAVVGRSGAGKTTLIDLVQGFYLPTSGNVLIGGVDISELPHAELQRHLALIAQDVFLFDGTLRENIADGAPDAPPEVIEEAAHRAMVTDFAAGLPGGLDTRTGPDGAALSGGQKQRVGIARALAKGAKVYIYDEATSALDGENERAIMQATLGRRDGSTVLFVTHRPSTLDWVDRVLVLEAGRLVGDGTPAALAAGNAAYRALFNLAGGEG